jgi:SAM-dependent methyltransferase
MVFALPYRDNCFDRVLSSLLLHHLVQKDKLRALRDTFRVLQHGGELHVADWGAPLNAMSKPGFLLVRMLDGFENTRDKAQGLLPELLRATGFRDVQETGRHSTVFGDLMLYAGRR